MKWGMICKPSKPSFAVADQIYQLMDDILLENKVAAQLGEDGYTIGELGDMADRLVVIGGDGTILMVMRRISKPMFTINTGQVGFMTEASVEDAVESMRKVLRGECYVEERMRIQTSLNGSRLHDATNEVTVHTSAVGKILSLRLLVDGVVTEELDGDGMIIATPTGSTSYALSVGGPIVDPSIDAFVVAPMAPFRHTASPLIIPADKTLQVHIMGKRDATVVTDGIQEGTLSRRGTLELSLSESTAKFIRLEQNFYRKVYETLSFHTKRHDV